MQLHILDDHVKLFKELHGDLLRAFLVLHLHFLFLKAFRFIFLFLLSLLLALLLPFAVQQVQALVHIGASGRRAR